MLKVLLRKCEQSQIIPKSKRLLVAPAACNCDTLLDASVTIYLNHMDYEYER